jgi:HK97 gp10 family phage protein
MGVTINSRADQIIGRLSSIGQIIEGKINAALEAARDAAPEQSGELRDSARIDSRGQLSWAFGFAAPHAPYVELGTASVDARPFLLPAVEQLRIKLPEAIKRGLEGGA